ncbi:Bug family tripartite tricarboxylate transporter substrate binding protein [Reyranella soli]|uniref:MFS transporter n=1 Tax=Reyranella soli TaxID=1230389 RepID=A0A512NR25_9HYPH|nr:tripartite tricarboxylate transporter substrate binding protein [Reyranella soli]GEP61391.1 MFS transporter [Reyranella soli]
MTGILTRRGALLGSLLAATPALAQTWPSRPIRYVVPFAAGAGVLDIMARIVAQRLSEKIDQQVVVDNKPGAGGNIGAEIVARAAPDGYTMLMANTALMVAPYLYAKMTFDPLVDLVPVTMVNSAPLMLVVRPSLPVRSVPEFLFYAKANPGKLNYGSGGVGTTPFLAAELLKSMTGINAVHVPYKGGAPALADLVAGQIAFMIENVPGTLPMVKDGKLRALAITSRKRSPLVPELPTMAEAGVPDYEMVGWNGVFLPKGTPGDIGAKLHAALTAVLRSKPVDEQMAALGAEAIGNRQATFAAFVKSESVRWGVLIKEKGIKPE